MPTPSTPPSPSPSPHLSEVAPGVFLVRGSSTNWVMLCESGQVTLVDTGYPADRALLHRALAETGHGTGDIAAVLVTHAHSDHIGSAEELSRAAGVPVLAHAAELANARRDVLQQISTATVLANMWRPSVPGWALHSLRAGGKRETPVSDPRPFPGEGPLDLPGRPVPVATPGHTDGHTAFHLPHAGVLITGDALVTGHPTSRVRGPQLLPRMFDAHRERARESLSVLAELAADTLLPGHGPAHSGPARAAAQEAYEKA
ncbi:MBL fold metallo-hydrolase [Streptomyces sp. NPDC054796]